MWGILSRFLTAAAVVGLASLAALPAFVKFTHEDTVVIRDIDPGGMIGTYDMWWHRVADSGVQVVIDGDCVSACAIMLGIIPPERVCMTDRGTFGLHMASTPNDDGILTPDQVATDWMIRRYYPPIVKKWIAEHGGLKPDVQYMKLADFKGYFRKCKKGEYDPWPVEASR